MRDFDYIKNPNLKIDLEIINYLTYIYELKGRVDLVLSSNLKLDRLENVERMSKK